MCILLGVLIFPLVQTWVHHLDLTWNILVWHLATLGSSCGLPVHPQHRPTLTLLVPFSLSIRMRIQNKLKWWYKHTIINIEISIRHMTRNMNICSNKSSTSASTDALAPYLAKNPDMARREAFPKFHPVIHTIASIRFPSYQPHSTLPALPCHCSWSSIYCGCFCTEPHPFSLTWGQCSSTLSLSLLHHQSVFSPLHYSHRCIC